MTVAHGEADEAVDQRRSRRAAHGPPGGGHRGLLERQPAEASSSPPKTVTIKARVQPLLTPDNYQPLIRALVESATAVVLPADPVHPPQRKDRRRRVRWTDRGGQPVDRLPASTCG